MKKIIIYLLALLSFVAISCTREEPSVEYEESLTANLSGSGRFAITATGKSVWNKGDKISVFMDDGGNESWSYAGSDSASSGEFKHVSQFYRFSIDKMKAIYPYNKDYITSSDAVPVTLGSASPVLAASREGFGNLDFHYLTSMIRLGLDRQEEVNFFVFRPFGTQTPGGAFSVDFSGSVPALKQTGSADSLVISGGTASEFLLNVPADNYTEGFSIDIEYASGARQTVRHTFAVDFKVGEVLDISTVSVNYSLVLNIDFRSKNPFQETFPTSKTSGGREDKTFTLVQDGESYKFKFHPGYFEYNPLTDPQGRSGPEYGYCRAKNNYFSPAQYGMSIGRDSSYIKLPAVSGKTLIKFEYLAGNVSNSVCLAKDSLGVEQYSRPLTSSYVGEIRTLYVDYLKRCENTPYFVYQSGGNYLLLWFKVYYR